MSFFKVGSTPILGVYQSSGKFSKCASKNADIKDNEHKTINKALNLISKEVIKSLAKVYNISDNINDYIFPVPRAVGADIPNSNGDRFAHEELLRYSSNHRCLVYQTFRNDPLHVEHAADNPKTARGFIPDAYYMQDDPKDRYVLTVVAMDTTKDPALADGLLSGEIDSFSMGCVCDAVQCSYSKCRKIAKTDRELCEHLRRYKMARINGELVYEDCLGVEYQELSVVGDPAYEKARTQYMLNINSHKQKIIDAQNNFSLIKSLVGEQDATQVAKFFKENLNRLPEAMLHLADKIL
jgi:hypothetical protein